MLDLAVGAATFVASAAAGMLWIIGGPGLTFAAGACIAVGTMMILLLQPKTQDLARESRKGSSS
jgi:hypothetical protein